jgi:DNA-binding CsgD family transcriptional regulator
MTNQEATGNGKLPLGVIVSNADGTVVEMNQKARDILGDDSLGKPGWDVMRDNPNIEGLPCYSGCACKVVAEGADHITAKQVSINGEAFHMSCVPVQATVVTTLVPLRRNKDETPRVKLTPREVDVLRLLAEGVTTGDAAVRMGVSESTVRTHVEHMRHKLGVNTRAALVANGFVLGYLDPDRL